MAFKHPGPNYAWHFDRYDKLKPYGFPVHACIDGFSQRILWLKVCRTNNDPAVTTSFYLEYVRFVNGCPILLRTDCGTKNGTMATMQCYFHSGAHDEFAGINAHKYALPIQIKGLKIGGPFYIETGHHGGLPFLRIKLQKVILTRRMNYKWNAYGFVF